MHDKLRSDVHSRGTRLGATPSTRADSDRFEQRLLDPQRAVDIGVAPPATDHTCLPIAIDTDRTRHREIKAAKCADAEGVASAAIEPNAPLDHQRDRNSGNRLHIETDSRLLAEA